MISSDKHYIEQKADKMDNYIKELNDIIEDAAVLDDSPTGGTQSLRQGIAPVIGVIAKGQSHPAPARRGAKWRYRDDQGNDLGTNAKKIVKDRTL
jgi:hypothetical protein